MPPSKTEATNGYAPQLAIEMFLCAKTYTNAATQAEFWQLKGTQPAGIVSSNIAVPVEALQIELEPAATRKPQVNNALKANDKDSDLFLAIAKVFWVERKPEKIRKWIKNAITLNQDNGDAWGLLLRFEMEFGNQQT